jgi:ammonia channel protein AmtB
MWQDIVFMLGGFIFSIALIPSIRNKNKPALSTSLSTAIVLCIFCIAYASMGFWLAFSAQVLSTIAWIILFIQGCKVR